MTLHEGYGGVPSWCRVGAKVVCIETFNGKGAMGWETLPKKGETYTIRAVDTAIKGFAGLLLVEIKNAPAIYVKGFGELAFWIGRFRPVHTLENDLETHFEQYLKTDHRAPEKVELAA